MPTKNQQPDALEAFCQFCPAPEEVTTFLEHTGIRLEFRMDAFLPPAYSHLAQVPAQFHFEGQAVMYNLRPFLGKPHRKRAQNIHNRGYLLILQIIDNLWNGSDLPGRCGAGRRAANASAHERAAQMLSTAWVLTWLSLEKLLVENPSSLEAVA